MFSLLFFMGLICFFAYVLTRQAVLNGWDIRTEYGDLVFVCVVGLPLATFFANSAIGLEYAWVVIGTPMLAAVWGARNGKVERLREEGSR